MDYAEDLLRSIHEFNMADVEDDEFREEFLLLCMHFFPDNTAFQDDYCEILSEKKQYKEAILLTLRIIEKHPYNYEAWFNLGRLYACSDQYAMALEAIEFARSCDKEDFPDLELDNLHAFCLFKEEGVESLIKKWNHCLSVSYSEDKLTDILMDVYYILDKHVEGYNFLNNRIILNISSIPFHAMTIYFCCCVKLSKEDEANEIVDYLIREGGENNAFIYLKMLAELCPQKGIPLNKAIVNILDTIIFSPEHYTDLLDVLPIVKEEKAYKEEAPEETMQAIAKSFFSEAGRNN